MQGQLIVDNHSKLLIKTDQIGKSAFISYGINEVSSFEKKKTVSVFNILKMVIVYT